ncbi:MAG: CopD family protein [Gemmatimonadaceae bacterium]|nr:CopD family protein [Acetobacteraceae bacterium]
MYLWLKALHVAAVMAWMAGMVVVPAVLAVHSGPGTVGALRRHFSKVTGPAMILALALGLWLALDGGWLRAGWLHGKLLLVVALAGAHGVLSGMLRRMQADPDRAAPRWVGSMTAAVLVTILAIAVLVVVKPGA